MKLSSKLNGLIVKQISRELYNANLYNQFEHELDGMGLENLSQYFRRQANEERGHANFLISFLNDRVGGKLQMLDIPFVEEDTSTIQNMAQIFFKAEQETTKHVEDILRTAMMEGDLLSFTILQPFLSEQLEEEKIAEDFLNRVNDALNNDTALFLLDQYYKA